MKRRSKLILAGVTVAAVAAVTVICMQGNPEDSGPQGPKVQIANPEEGALVEFVNAPGEIEPVTRVAISAKVGARIVDLPFKEGQVVTCGDPDADPPVPASVLVKLDSSDLEASLKSTEATRRARAAQIEVEKLRLSAERERLTGADASLLKARLDLERYEGLRKSSDATQSELDAARAHYAELKANRAAAQRSLEAAEKNIEVLQHNLEAADAEIARARDQVGYTTITSPINGVVTRMNVKVGELAVTGTMNNPGTVLLEVADLSTMLLVVRVDQGDVAKLEVGNHATVRVHAYPDETFEGTVESIALTNDVSSNGVKYYKAKVLLDTAGRRVYSGLTADVDIETCKHAGILKVPSQAVLPRKVEDLPEDIRKNDPNLDSTKTYSSVVYRFVDSKAVATPVKVGPSDLTHTIIEAGLTADDRVVIGPYKVLDGLKHDKTILDEDADKVESQTATADTGGRSGSDDQEA